ncbi:TPA: hypothetical protein QDC20_005952 [Burkholderia aenigmatica]|uniref:hypothetical protein n=1 Tax=Burkholderia sp. AU45251 TaxID=3059204 RepID=UPI00264F8290|nr:hypothetical protein [Burkholderia sp. AU45251]HDR9487771.1 hypothetical protein [Burkholderia aenigmatica]MDN7515627.1 hypothetical protein [Burkholderia sp. AU45251]HDR9519941.1 hypothetical protein [Burkholderia aenigmatica]HDR9596971.1 hypothetical protein [Burkholderia aenigmatica]HDR9604723.1 hypothetical protein [Burkholderia aenigmatica]
MTLRNLANSCASGTKNIHPVQGPHQLERMSSLTNYFSGSLARRCKTSDESDAPRHTALTHPAPPLDPVLSGDSRYFFAFSSK